MNQLPDDPGGMYDVDDTTGADTQDIEDFVDELWQVEVDRVQNEVVSVLVYICGHVYVRSFTVCLYSCTHMCIYRCNENNRITYHTDSCRVLICHNNEVIQA